MLVPAVFDVVPLVTSMLIARLIKWSPEDQSPQLLPLPKANMPCLPPVENCSALPLPACPPALTETPAPISTVAASAATPSMELVAVGQSPDPRCVITPLNAHKVELLLHKYSIYDGWSHVIAGLCSGFNVGIQGQLSCMYIFCQPQILPIVSQFHKHVHCQQASRWLLLQRFLARRA